MAVQRKAYTDNLISKKHNGLIKVITGIRRCGKFCLLFSLFKKAWALLQGLQRTQSKRELFGQRTYGPHLQEVRRVACCAAV